MGKIFRENRIFIYLFIIVFQLIGTVLLLFSKTEIHIAINGIHSKALDFVFKNITHLGDGVAAVVVIVILSFVSFRKTLSFAIASSVAGLLAQFFKRVFFSDVLRPKAFFGNMIDLYFVPGVDVHTTLSLPSGHTSTAFAMFFVLASFTTNKYLKILLFFVALLVGYSRMYLSQHFLVDVFFGGIIGVLSGFFTVYVISLVNNKWIDKSVLKLSNN